MPRRPGCLGGLPWINADLGAMWGQNSFQFRRSPPLAPPVDGQDLVVRDAAPNTGARAVGSQSGRPLDTPGTGFVRFPCRPVHG